jgi:glycosyltransferase involved in cell wall biosynthesis
VRETRRGYGNACLQALAHLPPQTEVIVFMDADGSDVPSEASALLEPIVRGEADLVLGSRVLGNAESGSLEAHQRGGNALATFLVRLLYGHRYSDLGPFRAIRAESLASLGMRDPNYGWTVEMQIRALQKGLRVLEVPVSYRRRRGGESKVSGNVLGSLKAGAKILWTVARLRLG